jgi:hypothetical protein
MPKLMASMYVTLTKKMIERGVFTEEQILREVFKWENKLKKRDQFISSKITPKLKKPKTLLHP